MPADIAQRLLQLARAFAKCARRITSDCQNRIEVLHAERDGVLGSPRIWKMFRYAGETCRLNRVARLMQSHAIQGILQRTRWRKKPVSLRPSDIINHLERDFAADAPNTKWVRVSFISVPRKVGYICAWWRICTPASSWVG